MGIVIATLFVFLPLFIALYVTTKHILNKIQNLPPSPLPCLPLIGHLYLLRKPIFRTLSKVSAQHGSILFLQFGCRHVLLVSSPELAEECLTKNDITFASRPRLLLGKYLGYNYTLLSWAPYGDHWRNLRRIASLELLSTNRLQMLSSVRAEEVKSLTFSLFRSRNQAVDMKMAFLELTLNIMMRMIAGKRYYGDSAGDAEEAQRFRDIHADTLKLSSVTNIGDYLPWFKSKKVEKIFIDCLKRRDEFMQQLLDEQRGHIQLNCGIEKKKNLLQVLLCLQESEPEYYTDDVIKGLMLILLLAGTDTSTNTMEWALSLLLNHPEALRKAQSEIDECVGNGRLVDEADVAHLPYLQSIINETLRMYPPAPLLSPHESSEECFVGGYRIPRGTMLLVNVWAIQNDPKTWENPREFKPERFEWLGEKAREGFKLMPFGHGRRSCPGEALGLRVVGLCLATLIQCFHWERVDNNKLIDMGEGITVTLPKAQHLKAMCRPRPSLPCSIFSLN